MKLFDKETFRLTGILFAFSAVVALMLGLVNNVTKDRIAEAQMAKTHAAMENVLPAEHYEKLNYSGDDANVVTVYKADDAGYVVECSVSGSQSMIGMVVGVDRSGTVTGIGITSHKETSGLGANAAADTEVGVNFREQFKGVSGPQAVTAAGGNIHALSGATVTSKAVTAGVNSAMDAVASLNGGGAGND